MADQNVYYYQKRLNEELAIRVERNPRYSMRSFAQSLGLRHSALSQIISGQRSISTKLIQRIFSVLELSSKDQKKIIKSVIQEKQDKGLKRISPSLTTWLKEIPSDTESKPARQVGLDEFRIISDWYHTAILELTHLPDFKADPRWIAKQLRISPVEAKLALERLLQLELLETVNKTLQKTNLKIESKDLSKTSLFHRKRQKQILEKSIQSLESDPIAERNHSGVTVCVDSKNIPEAKVRIQKFIWELAEFLMQGTPDRVYEINLGLFPLQNSEPKKEKTL